MSTRWIAVLAGAIALGVAGAPALAAQPPGPAVPQVLLIPTQPRTEFTTWAVVGDTFASEAACRAHQEQMLVWLADHPRGRLGYRMVELGRCVHPDEVDRFREFGALRHVR